jgi:hypothetical protein
MSGSTLSYHYNVGSETRLTIISNGVPLSGTILTEFESRQNTTLLDSKGMDGINRYRHLGEGWEGTLAFDRADSVIDDYFAALEAAQYLGRPPPTVEIVETIVNPNTNIPSKYRFEGVTMKMDTAGRRGGDSKIEQRIAWSCSRRVKVF